MIRDKKADRRRVPTGLGTLAILGLLSASFAEPTASGADPPTTSVLVEHCKVEYAQSSLIGAPESGLIKASLVRRGDRVTAGQTLAQLQDGAAKADMEARAAESGNDLDLRFSVLKHKQALLKLRASTALVRGNFLSNEQLKLDQIDAEIAEVAVDQAKQKAVLAKILYYRAEEAFRARQIVSPHDGVVSEVFKKQGEAGMTGEPMFRVDNVSRLQVLGRLDVVDCGRIRVGQKVRVRVEIGGAELPIELEWFAGSVVFVDTKIDPSTQTCLVISEVDNRDELLRAGLEAAMEIAEGPAGGASRPEEGRSPDRRNAATSRDEAGQVPGGPRSGISHETPSKDHARTSKS